MMKTSITIITALLCAAGGLRASGQDSIPITQLPVAAVAVAPVADKAVVLTREECVHIALDKNPTIRVADMELERMDYSKKETRAALFPTLDFSLNYQRSIELQTIKMNMGGQSQAIKMGSDNSWNMGFSLALPVIAPTLWKAMDLSDTQILLTQEKARSSRIDMVKAVNQAYYSLLLSRASKKVLEQNYENAKFNADLYEKKFKVGVASEYDVLRSSVQVKNLEPELQAADIAIKQSELQLKVLMGMDLKVNVNPADSLEAYQREMYEVPYSQSAPSLADNPSMRSMVLNTQLLEQTVDLKKRAFIPTVAATFNLAWSSLSNGNMFKNIDLNPYSTVGVAVSVPIFSGGSRYYGMKQAQVQLAESYLERENLENNLRMQVDLAIDNIDKEVKQIATSAESVRQAEKAHQIMQKSFEIGAGTYLELRDSELAETSARLVYLQAIYNYLVSNSELDALLGRNIPESTIK
ncbi:MAG: TolC family protein [Prevotella sp.]|nr:TolC family protein [Prevotella sp.]MCM1074147.1 TolC family protein [Ruminococcus sp.]